MDDDIEEELPSDVELDMGPEGGYKCYKDFVDALGRIDEPEYLRAAALGLFIENDHGLNVDRWIPMAAAVVRFIQTGETGIADLKVHNGPKKTVEQKS